MKKPLFVFFRHSEKCVIVKKSLKFVYFRTGFVIRQNLGAL